MSHRIADLARALGMEAAGDADLRIDRPAHPAEAGERDLAVAMTPSYAGDLRAGRARAAVLWPGADWRELGLSAALFAPRPRLAMSRLTERFATAPHAPEGVHPTAAIDPTAEIGAGASIGPFVWVGPGARIGPRARLMAHVSVGAGARLGADALLHPGVRLAERVTVGDRAILHSNAVIGSDGFSFVTAEPGAVEAAKTGRDLPARGAAEQLRIHSLGAVRLGDDVEVGAGAAIDRGTLRDTSVGSGTKIDNLVQLGHNVEIGEDCLICAHVGIAGSVRVGSRVVLGGKAGVADNVRIGDDVVVAGASMVAAHVPPRSVMMGAPAMPRTEFHRMFLALRRLPRVIDRMRGGD